jgi:hypothetical protein
MVFIVLLCISAYVCFISYFICTIWLNIIFRGEKSANEPRCFVTRRFPILFLIDPSFITISLCLFMSYIIFCMRTELVPVTLHVDGC